MRCCRVLSLYAAELEDATPLLIGLAVGAYGLTQAGLQIPLGALSDRDWPCAGHRRWPDSFSPPAASSRPSAIRYGASLPGSPVAGCWRHIRHTDGADRRRDTPGSSHALHGRSSVSASGCHSWSRWSPAPSIAARSFGVPSLFWLAAGLAVGAGLLLKGLPTSSGPRCRRTGISFRHSARPAAARSLRVSTARDPDGELRRVAVPAAESTRDAGDRSLADVRRRACSYRLLGTVPLIISDERKGKPKTIMIAVALLFPGRPAHSVFRELRRCAGIRLRWSYFLPDSTSSRRVCLRDLSLLADGECARRLAGCLLQRTVLRRVCRWPDWWSIPCVLAVPTDVFFVCALLAAIWLASSSLFKPAAEILEKSGW